MSLDRRNNLFREREKKRERMSLYTVTRLVWPRDAGSVRWVVRAPHLPQFVPQIKITHIVGVHSASAARTQGTILSGGFREGSICI